MAEWKRICINSNLIESTTGSAALFRMPHNSGYDGYCFWISDNLVRYSTKSQMVTISYTDDFIFRLKKYGKGRYNGRKVVSEIEIGAAEFEDAFSMLPQKLNPYETHKPDSVAVEPVEVLQELIDE